MHSYLPDVNATIVKPMIKMLQQIMIDFNFVSEAEIFASDLRFRMIDENKNSRCQFKIPLKIEDSMSRLKARLSRIIQRFQSKYEELVQNSK